MAYQNRLNLQKQFQRGHHPKQAQRLEKLLPMASQNMQIDLYLRYVSPISFILFEIQCGD